MIKTFLKLLTKTQSACSKTTLQITPQNRDKQQNFTVRHRRAVILLSATNCAAPEGQTGKPQQSRLQVGRDNWPHYRLHRGEVALDPLRLGRRHAACSGNCFVINWAGSGSCLFCFHPSIKTTKCLSLQRQIFQGVIWQQITGGTKQNISRINSFCWKMSYHKNCVRNQHLRPIQPLLHME